MRAFTIKDVGIFAAALLFTFYALYTYYPVAVDWETTFQPAVSHFRDPYGTTLFTNPPWALLFLPHGFLPLQAGNALNFLLNLLVFGYAVIRLGGDRTSLFLVFTCPFFFDLARTNNIEWLVVLGLIVPDRWKGVFLLIKPQVLGMMLLLTFKQSVQRWQMVAITSVFLLGSVLFYGDWFLRAAGLPDGYESWNLAPFPILIPVGAYLLYRAWQENDAYLAGLATFFFAPYVAVYSANSLMVILSTRQKRWAWVVWVMSYVMTIYLSRKLG